MVREIDWRDIPRLIQLSAKGIDRAAARTLNNVAFASLPKLVSQADRDMKFSSNARRALGWHVNKASHAKPEASVQTNRGWFGLHAKEGTRQATSSRVMVSGRQMLFIPRIKGAGVIDKRGRIRSAAWAGVYFIPKGDYALVFYRARKGSRQSELIGVAVHEAKFKRDTDWEAVIEHEFQSTATTILRRELDRQRQWD